MRSKSRITITIDAQCVKALKYMIKKGKYKSMSHAIEKLVTLGINVTPHDNLIEAIFSELKKI